MNEREPRRMQKMPTGRKPGDSPSSTSAVGVVTDHRVSDRREMNANLMGPPCVQMSAQQVSRTKAGEPDKIRLRLPSATDDCHTLSVSRVAGDGTVDGECVAGQMPPDHHRIPAVHPPRSESSGQNPVRPLGLRDNEKTRCFLVQAMNDAGPVRGRAGGKVGAPAK